MAQRMLGIDLGAHTVKVAQLDVGFRTVSLVQLDTWPVPAGDGSTLERSIAALAELDVRMEQVDMVSVSVPGDTVLSRVFDLPISDPKKLAAVVANELADDIPWELEDVVFDHMVLPGGRVTTVAARSDEVRELLASLEEREIDPLGLPPAPLVYGGLVQRIDPGATALVVDLGHQRTNVCLVSEGRALMGRTISRGGAQLTEAFRQALQLPAAEAEQIKEQNALLHAGEGRELEEQRQVLARVTAEALAPLFREVRLSADVFAAHLGRQPDRVLLCGGTSQIAGIEEYLAQPQLLNLPCQKLRPPSTETFSMGNLTEEGAAIGAQALAIGLDTGGRRGPDLRQGEFAYRTDTSVFREKLFAVAVAAVLVLFFVAINAFASIYSLRKEEKVLKTQLRQATRSVFGKSMMNGAKASREVKKGSRASGVGIPAKSAYDILNLMSKRIPSRMEPGNGAAAGEEGAGSGSGTKKKKKNRVNLDITRLDIKTGKTTFTGTADSRAAIGKIVKSLDDAPCIKRTTLGRISGVAQGKKQFSLTVETSCF